MNKPFTLWAWSVLLAACGTAPSPSSNPSSSPPAPPVLFSDLGRWHMTVTTASPEAQRWFDQGLTCVYSYSHREAIRSFEEAARIDPTCAMAFWGIALANGPHINFTPVPPDKAAAASAALVKARANQSRCTGLERELIDALNKRHADPQPEDRAPLDQAYAEAMRSLWQRYQDNADVATMCAEALMDLQPWDLWTGDGKPKGNTVEIQKMLEAALRMAPDHPGANHLYIHTVEASPAPDQAVPAADRLCTLVPGVSHMVHMPSHIYARVGRYADAVTANEKAIAVDKVKRARTPNTDLYQMYMAHNDQFLSFAAMMSGRSAIALAAAHRMVDAMPAEFLAAAGPIADGFMPIVLHGLVRFGRWEEVLKYPAFQKDMVCANAVRTYARGVSLTALNRLDEAATELHSLEAQVAEISKDDNPIGNNPAKTVLQVPLLLLRGELAFRQGRQEEGIARMREAVAIEDTLKYDEPPDWMMPARHPLGAALVQMRRWVDAELVYRQDLKKWPENGWSLFGLQRCLAAQGNQDEAARVQARFDKTWSQADVKLNSSCFCQPGV
jgi:tetratricopeptide (TPR) repeat protein